MDEPRQDVLLEPINSSSVSILDEALGTCQKQWTKGRDGERGSEISLQRTRHDYDDDDFVCTYTYS